MKMKFLNLKIILKNITIVIELEQNEDISENIYDQLIAFFIKIGYLIFFKIMIKFVIFIMIIN